MTRSGADDHAAACVRLLEQRAPRPLTISEMVRHARARALRPQAAQGGARGGGGDAEACAASARRATSGSASATGGERPAAASSLRVGAKRAAAKSAGRGTRRGPLLARARRLRLRRGAGPRRRALPARHPDPAPAWRARALHGDRVEVEIVRRDPRLRRVVGRIVAVTGPRARARHRHARARPARLVSGPGERAAAAGAS